MIAGAFLTPHTIADSSPNAPSGSPLLTPPAGVDRDTRNDNAAAAEGADSSDGAVDLFGNHVTDAVARYTFDQDGSLYELHSPRTELPRLRAPRS
ncbi:MAG TPA: hypothetical protein VGY48_08900 [Vicinamibacterales bacterium]|nr:hypothetical protein [Vicinamibacterales bacterium]